MMVVTLGGDEEVQARRAPPERSPAAVPAAACRLPQLPGPPRRGDRTPRPSPGVPLRALPGALPPAHGQRPAPLTPLGLGHSSQDATWETSPAYAATPGACLRLAWAGLRSEDPRARRRRRRTRRAAHLAR